MTVPAIRPPKRGTAEWKMWREFRNQLTDGDSARQSYDTPQSELMERCQNDLIDFTEFTYPSYIAEDAHRLIAQKLQKVLHGEIRRLMLFAPPQHGKSELVSIRFPPFWFAHRPDDPIIFTSYGATHAKAKASDARNLIDSPRFAQIFPKIRISPKTRGMASWAIDGYRGKYEAVGMGGPITGFGARLGIIDDPIKNWKESQSFSLREAQWAWYRTTFRTRIWEGGAIIIIMTRWHEDDLAGKLLKSEHDQWEVVRLPAVAESYEVRTKNNKLLKIKNAPLKDPLGRKEGEALCPIRYSLKELDQLKIDVGTAAWYAEYQGTPRAPEGNWLKRVWFTITYDIPHPNDAIFVRYWDKAGTENTGMYSTGVLMSYEKRFKRFTVLDVVRGRWSARRREEIIYETAVNDKKEWGYRVQIWVEQEPASGGKDQALTTIANLKGFDVHADPTRRSKEVRLNPGAYGFQAQAEAGFVYILNAPWNDPFLEEITTIPNTTYWDQTDATVGAFDKLNDRSTHWDVVANLGRIDDIVSPWR